MNRDKGFSVAIFATWITIIIFTFLAVIGCDEGMNMVSPVMTEPGEEQMNTPEGPTTTNGEMKQPPDEGPSEQKDPTPEEPEEPEKLETPAPEEPKPTVSINTVVQADDKSVTVSGTSTDVPEGTKVTIVLGDSAITVKTTIDKDGTWATTVPAGKTARLAPGTIAVTATAKKVTAESSFEIAPPTLTIDAAVPADDGSVTVSGTSTDFPEGTTVTIVLGEGAVTVKTTTDKTGAWIATVPATKAASLTAGTTAVTASASTATDTSSFEYTLPEPVIAIGTITSEADGSIVVSGTSTNLPAGETVTITLGDTVTVTATTDETGAWIATVPATKVASLTAGTTAVTASASTATDTRSFEHTLPGQIYGIPVSTEADRIKIEIVAEALGYDHSTASEKEQEYFTTNYGYINSEYGPLFDVETEVGRATFQRFAEYKRKIWEYFSSSIRDQELYDQYFEEAYGFSADYVRRLINEIYFEEKPEDRKLPRMQIHGVAKEYLLLQIDNPNATEEELQELLRQSIRAGNVTVAVQ